MSEDLIRRSDAIDALKNALCELGGDEWGDGELGVHADDIDAVINGIPTIEPKREEWIVITEPTEEYGEIKFKCSACGMVYAHEHRKGADIMWNFCPNCGADMRGKDDEMR